MNITSTGTNKNIYSPAKSASSAVKKSASGSFLDNIYTQPKSGSYNKVSADMGNIDIYSELQARAAASPEMIAEQKKKLADMYVPAATARKYYDPLLVGMHDSESNWAGEIKAEELETAAWNNAIRSSCMLVQLGAGELPKFMDYVMDSLKNGISFEQTLQKYLEQQPKPVGTILNGTFEYDDFLVNPANGDVMYAFMGGRVQHGRTDRELFIDREAVYELADDLNTFLRYAAFPKSDDDPERVSELISYIKNKQAYANFERFLEDDEKGVADTILQNLIDAGVLKGDDEDEEEEQEKAVDGLMEAIRIHQEELRENRIDIEESEKAIAEIREMTDGIKR